jgi:hypothetical protein
MAKKSSKPVLAYSEKDWQVEEDMRTLIRANEIQRDPKRLAAAKACARSKLSEKQAELAKMKALARK